MYVVLSLLCAVCAWRVYLCVRFLLKRRAMKKKLTYVCEKNGYEVAFSHCDFTIQKNGSEIRGVLVGARSKRAKLVFCDGGTYFFERRLSIPLRFEQSAVFPFFTRKRKLPSDERTDVILVCPACSDILYRKSNGEETMLGSFDCVQGVRLFSTESLCSNIERGDKIF